MTLLSASKVWLWVQHGGGIWNFLTWTKNHLSLHRHPEMSLEVVEETPLIIQENPFDLLLELVDAVPKWLFSIPDLLRKFWFVHLRLENEFSIFFGKYYFLRIESFRIDFWCVHRFQLVNFCNEHVTLPNSHRVQIVSKEQSKHDFLSKLMDSWLVLRNCRVILNQWTKWNDWSFLKFSKTPFVWSFPIIECFAEKYSIP